MDSIEDFEVDVQLFITCRMCVDEPGVYQIVPSIKELIKYCFDIDTDPFDGLPQLICKKCKSSLSDYHGVKSLFKLKELQLRERLVNAKNHYTQPKSETDKPITNKKIENGEMPTLPILPDASIAPVEPLASAKPVTPLLPNKKSKKVKESIKQVKDDTWKRTYDEYYFCKICTKRFQKPAGIKKHLSTHKKLFKKHKKVFRNDCTVQLNKVDNKKNCTGSSIVVVYSSDKIIASKENSHYYSLYLKKGINEKTISSEKRPGIIFDSSEEENVKAKKRKTLRLYSDSSTKTTILEVAKPACNIPNDTTEPGAQDARVTNANTVNVDDSYSDALSKKNINKENIMKQRQQEESKANIANYKAIQNIVTMCHKKHIKKDQTKNETQSKPTVSESSLKHKVLSLGRKVIHRQGFECTGLLRYMEHKDLEISWQPASRVNQNRSSNFVRIMPKLKSREDLESDETSWKDLNKIKHRKGHAIANDLNDNNTDNIDTANIIKVENRDESDQISTNNCDDLDSKNKLLNKTPVANPKQLPKKTPEIKSTTIKASDPAMPLLESVESENAEIDDSHLCMPIITSTQSLSTVNENEKQKDPVIDKPAPRIKVKPPSELMSQRAYMSQSEDIWAFNKRHASLPYHVSNTTVYTAAPMTQSQNERQSNDASDRYPNIVDNQVKSQTNFRDDKSLEYVTLHCLELPNEKTKFPFQYFKRVLQCHGFELLDINEALPAHFTCLVTFKLLLKQDTIRPLGVWLSLFCSNNSFCFAFKDTNSRKFDPNQLPAFWQWELLKIYKGDVVSKILANALKISKDVHSHTNNFLCLLKSIRCISQS